MTDANLTWIDLTDPADRCAHGPRPQNCLECLSAGSGTSAHLAAPFKSGQRRPSASMVSGGTERQFAYADRLARQLGFSTAGSAARVYGLPTVTRADWSAVIGELVAAVARDARDASELSDRLEAASRGTVQP